MFPDAHVIAGVIKDGLLLRAAYGEWLKAPHIEVVGISPCWLSFHMWCADHMFFFYVLLCMENGCFYHRNFD